MAKGTKGYSPHIEHKDLYRWASMVGVSPSDFQEEDTGSDGHFDKKGFEEAVQDAWANDYDARMTAQSASMAGEDVPEGINSLEDIESVYDFMKDTHEDELGRGGKFSSNGDMYGVSNYWAKQYRDSERDYLKDSFSDYIEENQEEAADEFDQQSTDITYSPEYQAAMSRINENEKNYFNSSFANFGTSNDPTKAIENSTNNVTDAKDYGDGKDQRVSASESFLKDYKLDLMQGLRDNPFGTTTTSAPSYTDY